jgi:hyperosmotically inducible protein
MKTMHPIATLFVTEYSRRVEQPAPMANPKSSAHLSSFRNALVVVGLAAGLGIGTVTAAPDDPSTPQAHSDSMGAAITDTAITAKVKLKLMGEEGLKKSHISVTTTNGVVTLSGWASSEDAKSLAETATTSVEAVKSVDNELKTHSSSKTAAKTKHAVATTERVVSDSWITTKVKSEILADSVSKGFHVGVRTVHGVVVLKGTLANQDAIDHVKDITEKVKGVKSVDTSALTVGR